MTSLVLTTLASALLLAAADRDPVAGEALFREGRRLLRAGDLAAACPKFEESQRLDPAVGTLANLAECEERLGRSATAWYHWNRVADQLPASDPRRASALSRAAGLEKTLPRLTIRPAPGQPSLTVARDGVALGPASLRVPLPLDPGRHRVLVTAPGRQAREYPLEVAPGEQRELVVEVGPTVTLDSASLAGGAGPAGLGLGAAAEAPVRRRRIAAYTLLGVSAAALGSGIYFGFEALSARRAADKVCGGGTNPPTCWSRARGPILRDERYTRLADVGFATAAVAAAVGGFLFFTSSGPGRALDVSVVPRAGGGEVGLVAPF